MMQLASRGFSHRSGGGWRLPEALPPMGTWTFRLFQLLWLAAFALAVIGPAAGLYDRFANAGQNSLLMPGSRAGIVVAEEDATRIRFPVGPVTSRLGIRPGDDIVGINGFPVSDVVPVTEAALANPRPENETDYALFSDILYGTEPADLLLRIRSPDGAERDVQIAMGEEHIEAGAGALGLSPALLGIVDLLHLVTYPFLLAAAWILHRRKPRDAVSAILSLAILLTLGTEQPSATFLASVAGLPRPAHMFLYDLGNIALLAGILLFPHGKLSPRLLGLLASLPVMFLLSGDIYRGVFMLFMLCAVLMLVGCLRRTAPGDLRQQIKWALFGFSGYAIFLAVSLTTDMLKTEVSSFSTQLLMETLAGLAMGVAFLSLQLGLLIALLRYRLYDAEVVISRSATFALVTLVLGGAFAAGMEAVEEAVKATLGRDAGAGAAILGAAVATVLISPAHERIQRWAERVFHKNLLHLRRDLPEAVRDLREVASLPELLADVLARVHNGVRTTRSAIIVEGKVQDVQDMPMEDAVRWLAGFSPSADPEKLECDPADIIFPVRVALCSGTLCLGWLAVGPRPDGTSLGEDEREVLAEVADPIARAIRIVLKREGNEREVSELLSQLGGRIDELEGKLDQLSGAAIEGAQIIAR